MTKVTRISDFVKFSQEHNELIFSVNNRVYQVSNQDVDFVECFGVEVCAYDDCGRGFEGIECHVSNLAECDQTELEIISRWAMEVNVVYDCTKEYLTETRHNFLAEIFRTAWKKTKTIIHNFSASLKETWKETKIALSNVVTFFKLSKDDEEVEVTTRQVRFIDVLSDGRFRFFDLINNHYISFHPFQLLAYETGQ